MALVAGIVAGVSVAAWLGMQAFRSERHVLLRSFADRRGRRRRPASASGSAAWWRRAASKRPPGTLDIQFLVTDFKHTVPVKYSGILPDLFREGQGVVAHGRLQGGTFVADEILAKHDEKYMPPEVARSLKDNPPPPDVPAGT